MLINELAQWAALVFVGVFVLGLTRQLGSFLVPQREQVALQTGPELGDELRAPLFEPGEAARLRELIAASGLGWGMIGVVDEDCAGCALFVERLERDGTPQGAPLALLSRKSDGHHRARLEQLAPIVIVDGDRLQQAELLTSPFVMIVDEQLRLRFKAVLPDLAIAVERWQQRDGVAHAPPEQVAAADGTAILQVHRG